MIDPTETIHRFDPTRGRPTVFDAEPPTEKMIRFAENLARRRGVALPARARWSRGACGQFIAKHSRKGVQR